ncbi:hypothetical protein C8258_09215 [Nocardia sp. MDA0666]|uniref:hypothetical protein n=1 Tax=Nocardia sp. MDA0666 TaxID=2135448 RepID=UPI000D124673|nr:hypothetical protein [Nocardia sp. MDA0666]PSR68664.1 hypothetical protein C8258_09215 [Nocardia sp. MDA0666]
MNYDVAGSSRSEPRHVDGGEGIVELLAKSRQLIDRAMDECRDDRAGGQDIVRVRPGEGWEQELQRLLQQSRKEAMLVVSSPLRIQPHYQSSRTVVEELLAAGRLVRLLYSCHYVETRSPDMLLRHPQVHAQTRVVDADFYNMIIIDKQVAAIWGGLGEQRPHGFVVREPALLRVIHQLASILWDSASDLSVYLELRSNEFDETALAVLRALNQGLKDEVAARQLSVSLRTYRRYVADIMMRLGVTTRFQIGVRAAELGLLDSP